MKSLIFIALIAVLLTKTAQAQTKHIETITRTGDELIIPYQKYVLDNGLTLIIHEDHSDPIVYVDVNYHVGSANEQEGRSGFAHFFEHMMFQGSEHIGDDQHFKIVSEAGGTLNGYTTTDKTNYWELLPSNQLETALWLESDRMGYFLDSVTKQKFEIQRATVINERAQRYENTPYGLNWEKSDQALYPTSHPYSWQTIGFIEDLKRVDVGDLKNFFLRWYGPNNATLTIAGDVNTAEVVKLCEKYFGTIPRGPAVNKVTIDPVVLNEDRYISYIDNIRGAQVTFTYPTIPSRHPDEAPLDVLADILAGNKGSVFYKNFNKAEEAQFAFAYNPCKELAGEFIIGVRTFPNKKLSAMDSLVRVSLKEFETRGVKDDDLLKFKSSYEADIINALASVKGKGSMLGSFQTSLNNPNYIVEDIKRYNNVTKSDVMRVYNKYIKNKHAVIISVCPKKDTLNKAKPDNFILPKRNTNNQESDEYKSLVYNKSKVTFDRSEQPAVPASKPVTVPKYWEHTYENGLNFIGSYSNEVPNVAIKIIIKAGHRYEGINRTGIAELLSSIMNESTVKYNADVLGGMLEKLGSNISVTNTSHNIVISISSLTKNIDTTFALAKEILFNPKFDKAEFKREKKLLLEDIENETTVATTISSNVFKKLIYGDNHIMGISNLGTKKTVEKITLTDLKNYYAEFISPNITNVVVVGDLKKDEVLNKLSFLKDWKNATTVLPTEPESPVNNKTKIYFVNKKDAAQSVIRIGHMSMAHDAYGDFYKSKIMNYTLGAAFNSRLNMSLREEHGYTYGARSGYYGNDFKGPFIAHSSVRGDVTDSAISVFMDEITAYVENGITQEELDFTKNSIEQKEALKYETNMQKVGFINRILVFDLEADFVKKQKEILSTITKTEIDKMAKKHLPYNNFVILVVGDKKLIYDKLLKLNYEVVELDLRGNLIK